MPVTYTLDIVKADADIADAITKKHAQNTDTDLDATFEATFLKKTEPVCNNNEVVCNNDEIVYN